MNKILILGGTGMVGKSLQQVFFNKNLNGVFIGSGQNKEFDLTNYDKVNKLFEKIKPNIVIHAAAKVGGIGFNKRNPGYLIKDNLQMGINVLDACVEYKIDNLYITSTCCSYPKFCPIPFKEDDLWNGKEEETNSPYGCAKKTIIKMSQAYREQYSLKTTCFVLANLYGPYDNFDLQDSHVIPALINKFVNAKNNNLPTVSLWGTGEATREFLYAPDCAEAIVNAVISDFDYSEPINLGTGKEISIKNLATLIKELVGYNGDIVCSGEVSDGQPRRCLDVNRAKQMLNWEAKTSLREGLIKTIEWYQKNSA